MRGGCGWWWSFGRSDKTSRQCSNIYIYWLWAHGHNTTPISHVGHDVLSLASHWSIHTIFCLWLVNVRPMTSSDWVLSVLCVMSLLSPCRCQVRYCINDTHSVTTTSWPTPPTLERSILYRYTHPPTKKFSVTQHMVLVFSFVHFIYHVHNILNIFCVLKINFRQILSQIAAHPNFEIFFCLWNK